MKWIERQCRSLWYAVVHAENPHCLMCGSTVNIEAHHTVPKSRGNPYVQYDPDYGIGLCAGCHRELPHSAHASPTRFILRAEPKLYAVLGIKRAEKIMEAYCYGHACRVKMDWRLVRNELAKRLEKAECSWMDADIEPEYGRAVGPDPSATMVGSQ